jgi:hypothetical protein
MVATTFLLVAPISKETTRKDEVIVTVEANTSGTW